MIVDRKKDLIIRGGENIYPREIEEVLYRHPAVKEATCLGVPDKIYGEAVAAFIVLKNKGSRLEVDELLAFCRQFLADYKCPEQVYIVDDIPKGSSGKLLRKELREKFAR